MSRPEGRCQRIWTRVIKELPARCLGPTISWNTAFPTKTFSTSTFKAANPFGLLSFESSLLRPRSALGMAPRPLTGTLRRRTFGSSPRSAFPYTARVSTPDGCPRGNTAVVLRAPANFPDVYHRHRPFAEQVNYTGESLHVPSGVPTSMATIPASPFTYVLCGTCGYLVSFDPLCSLWVHPPSPLLLTRHGRLRIIRVHVQFALGNLQGRPPLYSLRIDREHGRKHEPRGPAIYGELPMTLIIGFTRRNPHCLIRALLRKISGKTSY